MRASGFWKRSVRISTEIEEALASLTELRDKPAGADPSWSRASTRREAVLWPAVQRLLQDYPDISVEITVDNGLTDIVAERFHAGVRLGEQVEKDMIAVRIGPDMRMAVVGAPSYFASARAAADAAGPDRSQLHQSAPAHHGGSTPGSSRRAAAR